MIRVIETRQNSKHILEFPVHLLIYDSLRPLLTLCAADPARAVCAGDDQHGPRPGLLRRRLGHPRDGR